VHFRLLVTIDKKEAKTSKEARDTVYSKLVDDTSFVGGDSPQFFSGSVCDWFVIGGRWSGYLQKALWEKKLGKEWYTEAIKVAGLPKSNFGISMKDIGNKENQSKWQELWEKYGGKGKNPFGRNSYISGGEKDDAMLLTKKLYDTVLKEYEEKEEEEEGWIYYKDISDSFDEKPYVDMVGKKWIVVVDYHN